MTIALAVLFVLIAAIAVVFWFFYRSLDRRIAKILSQSVSLESRYALPEDLKDTYPAVLPAGEMDITGAWAAEQARRGIQVSDEEIDEQRRMWAAEGA